MAVKKAPFQTRLVLTMEDTGPLSDNWHHVFPTCDTNPDYSINSYPIEYQTVRMAVEMLKEGQGDTFTSDDRSIIMKAFAKLKKEGDSKELLDEFFPLMKPYLGKGKKEGKKPTSSGAQDGAGADEPAEAKPAEPKAEPAEAKPAEPKAKKARLDA